MNVAENAAYTGTATLTGGPIGAVTWTLSGPDGALFALSNQSDSGATVSLSKRNFEEPSDTNADNVYEYMLTATDADGNSASASASITVTDATETPEVASLWLGQFGRAVAQHALDGIAARIADPRIPSSEGSSIDGLGLEHVAVALARPGLYGEPSLTFRSLLDGGAFTTTLEQDPGGGSLAFWGRAAHSTFDGAARDVALTGEVTTTMLGTDYARGKWLAGLAVTRSWAEGDFHGSAADGGMESTLTAAIPYGSVRISERFSIWGAAGYGVGDAKFESGGEGQPALATDINWTMGSFGTRGKLFGGRGRAPAVAVLTDALWARTESDRTPELAASQSDVTRLRLALEGSWNVTLENGGRLAPKLEVGARNDGGDAETGFGLEVGGGIAWSYPGLGLGVDLLARHARRARGRGNGQPRVLRRHHGRSGPVQRTRSVLHATPGTRWSVDRRRASVALAGGILRPHERRAAGRALDFGGRLGAARVPRGVRRQPAPELRHGATFARTWPRLSTDAVGRQPRPRSGTVARHQGPTPRQRQQINRGGRATRGPGALVSARVLNHSASQYLSDWKVFCVSQDSATPKTPSVA